jgi:hypothetical protein
MFFLKESIFIERRKENNKNQMKDKEQSITHVFMSRYVTHNYIVKQQNKCNSYVSVVLNVRDVYMNLILSMQLEYSTSIYTNMYVIILHRSYFKISMNYLSEVF